MSDNASNPNPTPLFADTVDEGVHQGAEEGEKGATAAAAAAALTDAAAAPAEAPAADAAPAEAPAAADVASSTSSSSNGAATSTAAAVDDAPAAPPAAAAAVAVANGTEEKVAAPEVAHPAAAAPTGRLDSDDVMAEPSPAVESSSLAPIEEEKAAAPAAEPPTVAMDDVDDGDDSAKARAYSVVLTDIEGTTTPISFVHDVLFPHVTSKVEAFLAERLATDEVLADKVEALRKQAAKDVESGTPAGAELILPADAEDKDALRASIVANIKWQMAMDRKIGALKDFQGYMWKFAYESGTVKGVVYDDVIPALDRWAEASIPVYIYSSGSVDAQKLLFGYSDKGDLLKHFKGHFDTTIGSKLESGSYRKIAEEIGVDASSILFLTDNVHEVDAALEAGLSAVILARPGNAELDPAPVGDAGQLVQHRGSGKSASATYGGTNGNDANGGEATVPVPVPVAHTFAEVLARTELRMAGAAPSPMDIDHGAAAAADGGEKRGSRARAGGKGRRASATPRTPRGAKAAAADGEAGKDGTGGPMRTPRKRAGKPYEVPDGVTPRMTRSRSRQVSGSQE